jgi:hypothetical protein
LTTTDRRTHSGRYAATKFLVTVLRYVARTYVRFDRPSDQLLYVVVLPTWRALPVASCGYPGRIMFVPLALHAARGAVTVSSFGLRGRGSVEKEAIGRDRPGEDDAAERHGDARRRFYPAVFFRSLPEKTQGIPALHCLYIRFGRYSNICWAVRFRLGLCETWDLRRNGSPATQGWLLPGPITLGPSSDAWPVRAAGLGDFGV